MCICECVCAGHGTCIEVTRQLVGIGSLIQLCGILGTELRSSSMTGSAFIFRVTSMALSILFLRLSLLGLTSSVRLGLLACEPQRPTHLCLPQCRDSKCTLLCPDYSFFIWVLIVELRLLCLQVRHFTNWTISPAWQLFLFLYKGYNSLEFFGSALESHWLLPPRKS